MLIFWTYEMADIFNIWNYLNTPSICLNLVGPSGIKWDVFTTSQRRRTRNVSRRRLNDVDRTLCVLHYMFLIDGYNCWQGQNKGLVDLLNTWHSLNTPWESLNFVGSLCVEWDVFTTSYWRRVHNVSHRRLNDVDITLNVFTRHPC